MNRFDQGIRGPFSGKGTPGQIVYATYLVAKRHSIHINAVQNEALIAFMQLNNIGIDCSGFVFHLANCMNKETYGKGIADILLKNTKMPSWRAAWRVNANLLTSSEHTNTVSLRDVRAGDMIRLMGGRHLLYIVKVMPKTIVYAHSSYLSTAISGVHLSKITISSDKDALGLQKWHEKTLDNKNYGKENFNSFDGDSIRRFKWQ